MKKLTVLLFWIVVALFVSCKKEKKEEPVQDNPPVQASPDISMKISGTASVCTSCSYSWRSGNSRGMTINLPDTKKPILINFYLRPLPGVYNLIREDFTYKNHVTFQFSQDGTYYTAVTGTINVSESDTGNVGQITKMKATFTFKTDTISGKSLDVTEGSINFLK